MTTPKPLPRLTGHISQLQVESFTLQINLYSDSRRAVRDKLGIDRETGAVRLSPLQWARMLRYLSTGQSVVDFYVSEFIPEKGAPLKLVDVIGRDGDKAYWTVSGEVRICP